MGKNLREEQVVDHLVSDGIIDFPTLRIESEKGRVTIQIFYEELDTDDVELKVEQNLDQGNAETFEDVVDGDGNAISVKLKKADKSHIFNITDWSTDFGRISLVDKGGNTTGKITKIKWFIPQQ